MQDWDKDGELTDMAGARFATVAQIGAGDDDTVLMRAALAPGAFVPLHSHGDVECLYLLDGTLEVFLDGSGWQRVEAGRSVVIPGGVKHALRNAGERPIDTVLATTVRMSRFFREAGRPVVPGAPPAPPQPADIARLIEVSTRYGYWLATPEESARVTGG